MRVDVNPLIEAVMQGEPPARVYESAIVEADWQAGDPVPAGHMVVFGKLVKVGDHKSKSDKQQAAHQASTAAHDIEHSQWKAAGAARSARQRAAGGSDKGLDAEVKYGGSALQLAKKAADAHSAASIAHSTAAYDKSLPDDERAKHQELAQHHSQQRHQYLAVVNRNKRDNKALRRLGS